MTGEVPCDKACPLCWSARSSLMEGHPTLSVRIGGRICSNEPLFVARLRLTHEKGYWSTKNGQVAYGSIPYGLPYSMSAARLYGNAVEEPEDFIVAESFRARTRKKVCCVDD